MGLLLGVGLLVAGLDQEPHLLELGKLCPCLCSSQYQAGLNVLLRYTSADGHPRASVSTGCGPAGSALAQEWQGTWGGGDRGLQWLRALGGSQLGTDLCGQHQGSLEQLLSRLCTLERPASSLRSCPSAVCLCQGEFPTSAALVGDTAELRHSAVRQLGAGGKAGARLCCRGLGPAGGDLGGPTFPRSKRTDGRTALPWPRVPFQQGCIAHSSSHPTCLPVSEP